MAAELLHNLRALIELDSFFGVTALPRVIAPVEPSPGRQRVAPASESRQAPVEPRAELIPPPPPLRLDEVDQDPAQRLAEIEAQVRAVRWPFFPASHPAILGEGDPRAQLMFIGEAPGAEEAAQLRPFVGPAGQLLDRMIGAMKLRREQVYIANVLKHRPPGNRAPTPAEVAWALPWLAAQVDAIKPRVICTLGNVPLKALQGESAPGISRARGAAFTWRGVTCLPTFHPSYLLRNPETKKSAWADLQQVMMMLAA